MEAEFEHDRAVFEDAVAAHYVAPKLTLDQLGPYEIGAGAMQRIFDAACRRHGIHDWAPAQRFFRAANRVASETGSFHHRQELMAWLIGEELGASALAKAEGLGFHLSPARRAAMGNELKRAAPIHARAVKALAKSKDDKKALSDLGALARRYPGSGWALDGALRLASHASGSGKQKAARNHLESAGFILDWQVIGPFGQS